MKPKQSEHELQCLCVTWFRRTFKYKIFAIPNGGKRDMRTAAKLKAEGVVPGVPDLFIPAWNLWVEMKTLRGRVTPRQRDMIKHLLECGHKVEVIRTKIDFEMLCHRTEREHQMALDAEKEA